MMGVIADRSSNSGPDTDNLSKDRWDWIGQCKPRRCRRPAFSINDRACPGSGPLFVTDCTMWASERGARQLARAQSSQCWGELASTEQSVLGRVGEHRAVPGQLGRHFENVVVDCGRPYLFSLHAAMRVRVCPPEGEVAVTAASLRKMSQCHGNAAPEEQRPRAGYTRAATRARRFSQAQQ